MKQNRSFIWRTALQTDAEAIAAIYNETVNGGGHSPTLNKSNAANVGHLLRESRRNGWLNWVIEHDGQPVAWALLRAIVWGREVCHRTGDLSIYVRHDMQGQSLPMKMIAQVYREAPRHGYEAVSCWILGGNRKSLMVARAFRMSLWGCLPRAACYGDRVDDVMIYGVRFDDPEWRAYMERRIARAERRAGAV
ncbi:N-acetyltransferase family protein [Pseudoduganella sp. R-32]|uniref:GNAT family N-acetyltransferase n=1 Tax=Pseudoduganella sp. R-32 TaxID=3404061 RepID=UPI003CEE1895